MANLSLNHVYKVYPNGHKAVNDFTMEIEDKEFIVFVGPSGCGKSTTLRMIAGLEEITAGEIKIGDRTVNDVEPKERNVAMVFQNYALYPHFTVYENMAFGLKMRKTPKEEIDRRVREAAETLGITEYLNTKPKNMSGGQRQRVALGRAIVREPKVFLLDEPLSNLDAKLRTQMRTEIAKLHRKLQTTFIYVTHDQVEAMTMGTRIVVMKDGYVQQTDTPRNLYNYPCNKFVAGFIGTPQMSFFGGELNAEEGGVRIKFDNTSVDGLAPYRHFAKADEEYLHGKPVIFGVRSEHVSVDPRAYPFTAECRVYYTEDLGIDSQVYADFNTEAADSVQESPTRVIIKAPAGIKFEPGQIITVSLDMKNIHVFDAETENTVLPRIPQNRQIPAYVKGKTLHILGAELPIPPAISLNDGDYTVQVPIGAIKEGGPIFVECAGAEDINGTSLAEVRAQDKTLFLYAGGDVTSINIDLKQCTFSGESGSAAPISLQNRIDCKLVKRKVKMQDVVENKPKNRKTLQYYLQIQGAEFDYPQELARRLISGAGSLIYKDSLQMVFSPYSVAEGALTLPVEQILDYGAEKFARCTLGGAQINVLVPDGFSGDKIGFGLNFSNVEIFDQTLDIRLV